MTREEAQPAWEKIVDAGFENYYSLTPSQRVWFNVEPLITDGIVDHYINFGAEHNEDTIADLETLECTEIAEILKKVNTLFKDGNPPIDINKRNEEFGNLNAEQETLLDDIDRQFWKQCDYLEHTLMKFINKTGIGEIKG